MYRATLLKLTCSAGLIAALVLTGCSRTDRGQQSIPQAQPAQSSPTLSDPGLEGGLDQLDSQLNSLDQSLKDTDTLEDLK